MENNRASTTELFRLSTRNPRKFREMMKNGEGHFESRTIDEYLLELIKKYDISIADIVRLSLLSKSYVYQIFNGERQPSREVLIRIGIVVGCTVDELQHALMIGKEGVLYPQVRRDAALISCLAGGLTLSEADEFLQEIGEQKLL